MPMVPSLSQGPKGDPGVDGVDGVDGAFEISLADFQALVAAAATYADFQAAVAALP